jgi:citrate synthase
MAFPTDFFTVLFAIARTSGWLAQWEEMLLDKEQKIARPRQIYTGPGERPYKSSIDHGNVAGSHKDALRQ